MHRQQWRYAYYIILLDLRLFRAGNQNVRSHKSVGFDLRSLPSSGFSLGGISLTTSTQIITNRHDQNAKLKKNALIVVWSIIMPTINDVKPQPSEPIFVSHIRYLYKRFNIKTRQSS